MIYKILGWYNDKRILLYHWARKRRFKIRYYLKLLITLVPQIIIDLFSMSLLVIFIYTAYKADIKLMYKVLFILISLDLIIKNHEFLKERFKDIWNLKPENC